MPEPEGAAVLVPAAAVTPARSAPAAKLPDVLQAPDLRGKLDVPVPAVAAAVDRALGLN